LLYFSPNPVWAIKDKIVDRGEGAEKLYSDANIPFRAIFRADEFLSAT
jgi:hypothetical protein